MNYLAEIIAFERWLETNYLPISSQLLWYKMMNLFNRSGWSEWVIVDNLRLMAAMQMSREATLIKARDDLIKAGLMQYQKGKKGSPNKYKMSSLCNCTFKSVVQSEVQNEVFPVVQSVVQGVVESVDIYKQKQNKTNKNTNVQKAPEKVKHKRGNYKHVLLSDEELNKLSAEYGEDTTKAAIKFLDEYVEMKGYKHKSSYLAIRKWVVDAVREQGKKANNSTPNAKNRFHNFDQSNTDYDAMMWEIIRGDNQKGG